MVKDFEILLTKMALLSNFDVKKIFYLLLETSMLLLRQNLERSNFLKFLLEHEFFLPYIIELNEINKFELHNILGLLVKILIV